MNVVTGAFGYIGRYITRHLLEQDESVRTITTHPHKPNPFGAAVQAFPLDFDHPDEILRSLAGVKTLYNTYWVRFEYDGATFAKAVVNTALLFDLAKRAGVEKIVHISVTNASVNSDLPYYAGKARQEQALMDCGVPYAIVRPTLVFGREDILVNNIGWLVRKFPIFPIFGKGDYRLQPVYVGDLAEIAVDCARSAQSIQIDALGPETFSFKAFVQQIVNEIHPGRLLVQLPPRLGTALGSIIGWAMRDVLLTQAELQGLMDEMLTSTQAPNGSTIFSLWLREHKDEVGKQYSSELARHFLWKPDSKKV